MGARAATPGRARAATSGRNRTTKGSQMWIKPLRARVLTLATTIGLVLAATALTASAAQASGSDLPAPTNTAPVTGTGTGSGLGEPKLVNVRTGWHAAYDRTVFDFVGGTPGYRVEYGTLVRGGTGDPIPLTGPADLVIVFTPAFAHDVNTGATTYDISQVLDPSLPTLRQIKFGEDFEAHVSAGLGLADRVGFRVFQLHNPDRVVVDVAHQPTQPFGFDTVWVGDAAADTVVHGVRSGSHPGYDRLVFDLDTPEVPLVFVAYRLNTATLVVGFSGQNVPAVVGGPRTVQFGLPQLRSLSWSVYDNGTASAFVNTATRHGFRVMVLYQPTRLVVDLAY
jgi:hypothetical protein